MKPHFPDSFRRRATLAAVLLAASCTTTRIEETVVEYVPAPEAVYFVVNTEIPAEVDGVRPRGSHP